MAIGTVDAIVCSEPLLVVDADTRVVHMNLAAEALLGRSAAEVLGKTCQEVLHARTANGRATCGAGCRQTRSSRHGWPVPPMHLTIDTADGSRPVTVSTLVLVGRDGPLLCRVLREHVTPPPGDASSAGQATLTPRQLEVLGLLSAGVSARGVARRLGVTEATARNHIRAILVELRAHSQLEAVARARELRLVV